MLVTRALVGLAALLALAISACGGDDTGHVPVPPTDSPDETAGSVVFGGAFSSEPEGHEAVTYDEAAVPAEAAAQVTVASADGGTVFTLSVTGLQADRGFGAHLHTEPCGADPAAAGPHYQDEVDPEQPSTSPEYANPDNEVWLDFTTDSRGEAEATATVGWPPRPGEANSVVIHTRHTSTAAGEAGTAGDRLACVNVPL